MDECTIEISTVYASYRSGGWQLYFTIDPRSHGPMGICIIMKSDLSILRCTICARHVPRKGHEVEKPFKLI